MADDREDVSMHARAVRDHGPIPACPMCGGSAYLVWPQHRDQGRFKCLDTSCGTEGGSGSTIAEAFAKWSRRA